MIKVVNKRTHKPTPNDIYIGRGSNLGNPFTHKPIGNTKAEYQCKTRDESIDMYGNWIENKVNICDKKVFDALREIQMKSENGTVYLVCYCKPLKCHGDIVKAMIEHIDW